MFLVWFYSYVYIRFYFSIFFFGFGFVFYYFFVVFADFNVVIFGDLELRCQVSRSGQWGLGEGCQGAVDIRGGIGFKGVDVFIGDFSFSFRFLLFLVWLGLVYYRSLFCMGFLYLDFRFLGKWFQGQGLDFVQSSFRGLGWGMIWGWFCVYGVLGFQRILYILY